MSASVRFLIGVGSNLGDRLASLRSAVASLAALPNARLVRGSSVWETKPVGPGTGPFLNAALELELDRDAGQDSTALAVSLLEALLVVERAHGRLRRERWGDRSLDLDLLCGYSDGGELVIDVPSLTLPHPELGARDFVLQPLVDIDPDLAIGGVSVSDRLARLPDEDRTLLHQLPDSWV